MPFIVPFLPAIIGAGASIAGSSLASGSKTSTSTTGVSPAYKGTQDDLLATLQKMLADPTGGLAPARSADSAGINRAYATLPNTATSKLAARGFGSSGKVGDAVYDTEGARLGEQSNLYGKYATLGSQRQMSAAEMIQQILSGNKTSTTTTPGNGLAAGLISGGNALENLVSLKTLLAHMNGGGSAAPPPSYGGFANLDGSNPIRFDPASLITGLNPPPAQPNPQAGTGFGGL